MLGIAFLHLLPHGAEMLGSSATAGAGTLTGLIVMFLLIRLFHTHEHGVPVTENGDEVEADRSSACDHHHHDKKARGLSWAGLFAGLLLHTLFDGVGPGWGWQAWGRFWPSPCTSRSTRSRSRR
jgi:zinc and cadmium transporter